MHRCVHRAEHAASNVPALSSVSVSVAYRPISARMWPAAGRPVPGREPGQSEDVRHHLRLARILQVARGHPCRRSARRRQSTNRRVVHRQHRIEPQVGRIDDRRAGGDELGVQRVAALGLLVAHVAYAEPVATVRRVARVAAVPHHRHAQPSWRPEPRLRHMPAPLPRPRARDLGLSFGALPTGAAQRHHRRARRPRRSRHAVARRRRRAHRAHGRHRHRARRPEALFRRPMPAAPAVLNGAGELTGSVEMAEWGVLETPILLTGTSSVGRVADGIVDELFAAGVDEVVIPVVGECDDSWLDDIRRRWVTAEHARRGHRSGHRRAGRRGRGRRRHRDGHHGPQGRHRHVVACARRAGHGGRAAAVQLRWAVAAAHRRKVGRRGAADRTPRLGAHARHRRQLPGRGGHRRAARRAPAATRGTACRPRPGAHGFGRRTTAAATSSARSAPPTAFPAMPKAA